MKTNVEKLRERIIENYEEFKSETLDVLDKEDIFGMARSIAAIEDVHYFITSHNNWVDEGEAAYLLEFCEPLKLLADAWEEHIDESGPDFRMIVEDALDRNDNPNNYVTVALADDLRQKHGEHVHFKDALLAEAIAAGKKYLQLRELLKDDGIALSVDGDN